MKTFRAHSSFVPTSVADKSVVVLSNTDYDVIDTNQAFGLYIKILTSPYRTAENNFTSVYISPEEIENYGQVLNKLTVNELRTILDQISFAPSCVDFNWGWEIVEVNGNSGSSTDENNNHSIRGFLINTTFKRPDTNTGLMGIGKGRRMWVEETASETSVVMTAWVCVDLIVRHELMEGYLYQGAKILNPHKTLEQLAYPEKLK